MASASTQVALTIFGLLAVAAVGALVLPDPESRVEAHQVPLVPGTTVNADQVQLTLSASGGANSVRILAPNDPRKALVAISVGPAGTVVNVLDQSTPVLTTGATLPVVVEGDVQRDEVVTFRLPSVAGANYWVKLDRSTEPATITLAPAFLAPTTGTPAAPLVPSAIRAPIAWTGEAVDPTDIAVFQPNASKPLEDGQLIFRYRDHGDGTSSLSYRNPQTNQLDESPRVPHAQLAMQGSPLERTWSVRLLVPGQQPTVFTVPLELVRSQFALGGQDPEPYLRIARDALYDTKAYKAASDGTRTLAPADLTGAKFLNGASAAQQRIFVDVPERQLVGTPSIRLEADAGPAPLQVPMARGPAENGFVRHEAAVPGAWLGSLADGATVKFSVVYKSSAAKTVSEELVDDNHGAYYKYRVDRLGPSVAQVEVAVPDPAAPQNLVVSWTASDGGAGLGAFKVEKQRDAGAWEAVTQATPLTSMPFTGTPGATYQFRVTGTDAVGNAGPPALSQGHAIPAGQGAENRAPTVQLLQPTGGEAYTGIARLTVKWRASDPDGTVPVINVYYSDDGGATWMPLASPSGTEYAWDLRALAPGEYRVKVEATDGSLSNQDTSQRFGVDNTALGTASTIGGANAQGLPAGGGAPAEGSPSGQVQGGAAAAVDPMLVLGLAVVLIGCAAGVAVWRWRGLR